MEVVIHVAKVGVLSSSVFRSSFFCFLVLMLILLMRSGSCSCLLVIGPLNKLD